MNRVLEIGTFIGQRSSLKIITPLANHSKVEILKMALDLEVPIHLTWSCHGKGEKACGRCEACRTRRNIFNQVGIKDPVDYE
jgi:7-cyano-7-deazaguanine synthase